MASSARKSFSSTGYGTWRAHSMSGPKPVRYFSCPVSATVATVRPWKLPSNESTSMRSGRPLMVVW